MDDFSEICNIISSIKTKEEIKAFMTEIFTESEIAALSKRWRILKMLNQGVTQRDIVKKLNVSLCNVTRGAKILKKQDTAVTKYLVKEK